MIFYKKETEKIELLVRPDATLLDRQLHLLELVRLRKNKMVRSLVFCPFKFVSNTGFNNDLRPAPANIFTDFLSSK